MKLKYTKTLNPFTNMHRKYREDSKTSWELSFPYFLFQSSFLIPKILVLSQSNPCLVFTCSNCFHVFPFQLLPCFSHSQNSVKTPVQPQKKTQWKIKEIQISPITIYNNMQAQITQICNPNQQPCKPNIFKYCKHNPKPNKQNLSLQTKHCGNRKEEIKDYLPFLKPLKWKWKEWVLWWRDDEIKIERERDNRRR